MSFTTGLHLRRLSIKRMELMGTPGNGKPLWPTNCSLGEFPLQGVTEDIAEVTCKGCREALARESITTLTPLEELEAPELEHLAAHPRAHDVCYYCGGYLRMPGRKYCQRCAQRFGRKQ